MFFIRLNIQNAETEFLKRHKSNSRRSADMIREQNTFTPECHVKLQANNSLEAFESQRKNYAIFHLMMKRMIFSQLEPL